jgi:cytidylate kinase
MVSAKIIAIDGPAASGKSTLGQRLAEHLGYLYFDTGVMYRAVTWEALRRGVDIADEAAITALAEQIQIDVRPPSRGDGRSYDVLVDSADITWEIRLPQVDANVSVVSAYPGVRQSMTVQQRRVGLRGSVVMVGRDIGTVVLPEADLKVYLDASPQERARRRYHELRLRGELADLQSILRSMQERDRIDSTRPVSPLRPADDAILLDSDHLDADQVFNRVKELLAGDER